jgi:hypothetical protein
MRDLERKDGDRGDAQRFCLADSGWQGAVRDYVSVAGGLWLRDNKPHLKSSFADKDTFGRSFPA